MNNDKKRLEKQADIIINKYKDNSENREYKSDVFSLLMEYPEYALDVYNALNGSSYSDPSIVEIKTLEKGISLTIRNDSSFIVDSTLNIYEHQSKYNPNMPLRSLIYLAEILKPYIKDRAIYGSQLIEIPKPNFVVLYNGVENKNVPPIEKLRLSDAYRHGENDVNIELICTVYNINKGNNENITSASYVLSGYMTFVEKVRDNIKEKVTNPIKRAIDYCIKQDVLKEFFKERGDEVIKVMTIDMTFERQIELTKRDYFQDGFNQGISQGMSQGDSMRLINMIIKKVAKNKDLSQIADELEEEVSGIQGIYDAIKNNPEKTADEIYAMCVK